MPRESPVQKVFVFIILGICNLFESLNYLFLPIKLSLLKESSQYSPGVLYAPVMLLLVLLAILVFFTSIYGFIAFSKDEPKKFKKVR